MWLSEGKIVKVIEIFVYMYLLALHKFNFIFEKSVHEFQMIWTTSAGKFGATFKLGLSMKPCIFVVFICDPVINVKNINLIQSIFIYVHMYLINK